MIPFLSNAHTHSTYCDGKHTPNEIIDAAKAKGLVSLGFSGHAHTGFHSPWSMTPERQAAYFQELKSLQTSTQDIRIWAGLELDAQTSPEILALAHRADYCIGSMHYFTTDPCGPQADGNPEVLKQYMDEAFDGSGVELARHYYDILVEFVNRERPEIIGHFDLIRKHASSAHLFDENDPAYRKVALAALEQIHPSGGVLELNTGGMARGYMTTPYPTQEILNAWCEMGGRVTITSDCHDRSMLTYAFDKAYDMVKTAGFKAVYLLGTGADLWDEVAVK